MSDALPCSTCRTCMSGSGFPPDGSCTRFRERAHTRARRAHGARGRVGVRQDDAQPRADGPAASQRERRRPRAAGRRRHPRGRRRHGPTAPLERHRDGLPRRDERVQSGPAHRRPDRRGDGAARGRPRPRGPRTLRRAARARRHSRRARQALPARVLGRYAAAGRDRDGALHASRASCWPTSRRRRST